MVFEINILSLPFILSLNKFLANELQVDKNGTEQNEIDAVTEIITEKPEQVKVKLTEAQKQIETIIAEAVAEVVQNFILDSEFKDSTHLHQRLRDNAVKYIIIGMSMADALKLAYDEIGT